jgi:hypothetical protein
MASLAEQLHAQNESNRSKWAPETLATLESETKKLVDSGIAQKAIHSGQ